MLSVGEGNGTQSIAWQINEETYRQKLEAESAESTSLPGNPGLQIYYGSIHDILSYPCEVRCFLFLLLLLIVMNLQSGKANMIQAASTSIHGPHGQHIENIHLQPYASEEDFFTTLYRERYSGLLEKAKAFVGETDSDDVLVFIRSAALLLASYLCDS